MNGTDTGGNSPREEINRLKSELEKSRSENEVMKQEYSRTMEEAEAHFRKYRARLESQIEEKNKEIQGLKGNRGTEGEEIESIKEKFSALKDGALKELKEFRELIVKHKICSQEEVKQRGTAALADFLAQDRDRLGTVEKKRLEDTVAKLQQKVADLEDKNQNLSTMIEYTKEQSNNVEFKKCQEYIKELEKRLAGASDKELVKAKDENTILRAENMAFSREIASLNRKLEAINEQQSKQTAPGVPTHPLFWQNFMSNLESLLNERETKAQPLQDKYIQTADKLTKPIFQRVIELKSKCGRPSQERVAAGEPLQPGPSMPSQAQRAPSSSPPSEHEIPISSRGAESGGRRYKSLKNHPNFTYEKDIENAETLENIIFEQEDYIQKLEAALDQYFSNQRDPLRMV